MRGAQRSPLPGIAQFGRDRVWADDQNSRGRRVSTPKARSLSKAPTYASLAIDHHSGCPRKRHTPGRRPMIAALLHGAWNAIEQAGQFLGVLLLDTQDSLQHSTGGRIGVSDVVDELAIAVYGDPFGDEVFLDHVD